MQMTELLPLKLYPFTLNRFYGARSPTIPVQDFQLICWRVCVCGGELHINMQLRIFLCILTYMYNKQYEITKTSFHR